MKAFSAISNKQERKSLKGEEKAEKPEEGTGTDPAHRMSDPGQVAFPTDAFLSLAEWCIPVIPEYSKG